MFKPLHFGEKLSSLLNGFMVNVISNITTFMQPLHIR